MKKIIILAAVLVCLGGCVVNTIHGSGKIVIEDRKISSFDSIHLSGSGQLTIIQGDTESLTVKTDDNIMKLIKTEVKSRTLEISYEKPNFRTMIKPSQRNEYVLEVIGLKSIHISGSADINSNKLVMEDFDLQVTGSADVNIKDLDVENLKVKISGAGDINLKGKAGIQEINVSGKCDYRARDLESREVDLKISGAGNAAVKVSDRLDISISGVGDVEYQGSPEITQSITGKGKIKQIKEKE